MNKKRLSVLLIIAVMALCFVGCDKKTVTTSEEVITFKEGPLITTTEEKVSTETSISETTETSAPTKVTSTEDEDYINFKLLILNQCKADIGLVAILNPVTEEQENVGGLEDGKALSFAFEGWPKDVTSLSLAFYNKNGDLVSTTEVNITGVKEKVTVALSGEGNIDEVKGIID